MSVNPSERKTWALPAALVPIELLCSGQPWPERSWPMEGSMGPHSTVAETRLGAVAEGNDRLQVHKDSKMKKDTGLRQKKESSCIKWKV